MHFFKPKPKHPTAHFARTVGLGFSKKNAILLILLCTFHLPTAQAAKAILDDDAPKVAIIIANNIGLSHEARLRFAEADGLRMAQVLLDLGGYPKENIHLLLGHSADEVKDALTQLQHQLKIRFAKNKSKRSPTILLYYSGHSDGTSLHMQGQELSTDKVSLFLDSFEKGVRIALIDACKSGQLIRKKGLIPATPFDIQIKRDPNIDGKIVITSSGADEVAQESDILEGSFFTHFFVSGLYGQADQNKDHRVTLEEAYRFAHYNTVQKTIAASGGVQHPSYLFSLKGEGDVVLSNLAAASAKLIVKAPLLKKGLIPARYFVLDAEKQLVLSEFILDENQRATLHLPPGKYQVRKRASHQLWAVEVQLKKGDVHSVLKTDFHEVDWQHAGAAKGMLINTLKKENALAKLFPQHLQARFSFGARQGFIPQMEPAFELQLGSRFLWPYFFIEPRLGFRGAEYGSDTVRFFHSQVDLGMAAGPRYRYHDVEFALGTAGSIVLMGDQKSIGGLSLGIDGINNGIFSGALLNRNFAEIGLYLTDALALHLIANADFFFFRSENTFWQGLQNPIFGGQMALSWTF